MHQFHLENAFGTVMRKAFIAENDGGAVISAFRFQGYTVTQSEFPKHLLSEEIRAEVGRSGWCQVKA